MAGILVLQRVLKIVNLQIFFKSSSNGVIITMESTCCLGKVGKLKKCENSYLFIHI